MKGKSSFYFLGGFVFVVAFTLQCCSVNKNNMKAEKHSLQHQYWTLVSIKGETIDKEVIPTPYIIFDTASRYYGNFGCNKFFGEYYAGKKKISLSYAGATKRLCPDMDTEKKFYTVIREKITHYKIENKTLILFNKKTEILRFSANDTIVNPI